MNHLTDTIIAPATPQGQSAIAIIRLSGKEAISITDRIFKGKMLRDADSHTVHYGWIVDGEKEIDEVMVTLFRAPKSFTTEDSTEISCHGSPQLVQSIISLAIKNGAKLAYPGEFTLRAFLNGRLDLSQAEAVADLIHASSAKSSEIALNQLKGHFSSKLKELREQLVNFAALIELELDFSEEDVEFANRSQLKKLIQTFQRKIAQLIKSFQLGNVIKNGVAVAIIGQPNAGKSTLLNSLLNEERAIVSNIAGTTRDTIEESLNINGIIFRIIDTAGIRDHSADTIENLGIERSRQYAEKAGIIVHLHDASGNKYEDQKIANWLKPYATKVIDLYNKADILQEEMGNERTDLLLMQGYISATNTNDISLVKEMLYNKVVEEDITLENTIVTNARHLTALRETQKSLNAVEKGLTQKISGDLMSVDIRRALHYIGEITGRVEVDKDILGTIFGKFCIGK